MKNKKFNTEIKPIADTNISDDNDKEVTLSSELKNTDAKIIAAALHDMMASRKYKPIAGVKFPTDSEEEINDGRINYSIGCTDILEYAYSESNAVFYNILLDLDEHISKKPKGESITHDEFTRIVYSNIRKCGIFLPHYYDIYVTNNNTNIASLNELETISRMVVTFLETGDDRQYFRKENNHLGQIMSIPTLTLNSIKWIVKYLQKYDPIIYEKYIVKIKDDVPYKIKELET